MKLLSLLLVISFTRFVVLTILLLTPVIAQSQTHFVAFLEASEEDPTFVIPGHGYAHAILNKERTELSYSVSIWKTSDTATTAHFHAAPRRLNGDIVHHLDMERGLVAVGKWTKGDAKNPLTDALIDSLFASKIYVNMHTQQNSGGEIRGQFFQPKAFPMVADAEQEVPSPGSADTLTGIGAGFVLHDAVNGTLFYRFSASGLRSAPTMAHIHFGSFGRPGLVRKNTPLDPASVTTTGFWVPDEATQPLTSESMTDLMRDSLYWNIHTVNHPPGELRGQIVDEPNGYLFMAMLSGSHEAGVNPSPAEGTAVLYLTPTLDTLHTITVASGLSSPIEDGHIHVARANKTGIPVVHLPKVETGLKHVWTSSDPERPLTRADVDSLFNAAYYINVHTQNFLNGEIRGQIIPVSQPPGAASVKTPQGTSDLRLYQNYPNPFRTSSEISYFLPEASSVVFRVYNMLGENVRSVNAGMKNPGDHSLRLDFSELPAGVYQAVLSVGTEKRAIRMVRSR